nr:acyltransferase [uncultured Blautia sp.]
MEKRWETLDILKCLCAFGVISIHRGFPGETGMYLKIFFRFAVPVFFMITGFFYSDTIRKGKQKKQILKILKIGILANLFYFAWDLFLVYYRGTGNIPGKIQKLLTPEKIRDLFIANESPFRSHLWYLGAILYVLILAAWLVKKEKQYWMLLLTPVLLAGDLIFGKYSLLLWKQEINYIYVRNYLFVGIPYFAIGWSLGIHKERKLRKSRWWKGILPLAGMAVFTWTSLWERRYLESVQANAAREHYLSTTFLTICVFLVFLCWAGFYKRRILSGLLAWIGRNCATMIYILHPAVITVMDLYLKNRTDSLGMVYRTYAPALIFACTTIISMILFGIKNILIKIKQ